MHSNILKLGECAFVIVDVQEAFRQSIPDFGDISRRIAAFAEGAKLLNVPVIVTEQYPKGLGHIAERITQALPGNALIIEKTAFSSCGVAAFNDELTKTRARQIILAGIEAHICVNQTAHDLLAQGFAVHLLADGTSSRTEQNKNVGLNKMQSSGAILSSVETALFELLRDARHEQFKAVQKLIK